MNTHLYFLLLCLVSVIYSTPIEFESWKAIYNEDEHSFVSEEEIPDHLFSPRDDTNLPKVFGNGGKQLIFRTNFHYENDEELSLKLSPTDHPFRVYINGKKVFHYGVAEPQYCAASFRADLVMIPQEVLKEDNNTVDIIIYPRGNSSGLPLLVIDTYKDNANREALQTLLSSTVIAVLSSTNFLIAFFVLLFWLCSKRRERQQLLIGLGTLSFALGSIHFIISSAGMHELLIWKISRSSIAFTPTLLMVAIAARATDSPIQKWINRVLLTCLFAVGIIIFTAGNKSELEQTFSVASSFFMIPSLLVAGGYAIRNVFHLKTKSELFIIFGVVIVIATSLFDLIYFELRLTPFFWTSTYGFFILELAVLYAIVRDFWKLQLQNALKNAEIEKRNEELRLQTSQIENLSSSKSRFLRNMAHEFKTPLHGIFSTIDLVSKNEAEQVAMQSIYQSLSVQMQKHLYNIQDIMDLSILENEKPQITSQVFETDQLLKTIELMFSTSEKHPNTRLSINCVNKLPHRVIGDKNSITRIIINFLQNAVSEDQYSEITCSFQWLEEKEAIEVSISNDTHHLSERVIDCITTNDQHNSMIYAKDDTINDLSISVAAQLVPYLSGTIELNDEHNQLTMIFPLQIEEREPVSVPNNMVLVVEDNSVNRILMQKIVEKMGYDVITAVDGIDGVEKTVEHTPSVILMDVQMPRMCGIEATKKIRITHPDTVIIALTANADREECLKAGMNNYLPKPAQPNDVQHMLNHYLAS
ncbi:MAG: response regulator [Colwellia sp.]|nr:response regulator [Colwellia sp.]